MRSRRSPRSSLPPPMADEDEVRIQCLPFAVGLTAEIEALYVKFSQRFKVTPAKHRRTGCGSTRLEYQSRPAVSGASSFKHLLARLPPHVHSVYYRDEIGNIPSSHLRNDALKKLKDEMIKRLQNQLIHRLQMENDEQYELIEMLQKEKDEQDVLIQTLEKEKDELRNNTSDEAIQRMKKEKKRLHKQDQLIQSLLKEKDEQDELIETLHKENDELQNENDELQQHIQRLENKNDELDQLIETLEKENDELLWKMNRKRRG